VRHPAHGLGCQEGRVTATIYFKFKSRNKLPAAANPMTAAATAKPVSNALIRLAAAAAGAGRAAGAAAAVAGR